MWRVANCSFGSGPLQNSAALLASACGVLREQTRLWSAAPELQPEEDSLLERATEASTAAPKRSVSQRLEQLVRDGSVSIDLLGKPNRKTGLPRALSAYIFYLKEHMAEIKQGLGPHVNATALSKLGAERWKALPQWDKAKYEELAQRSKQQASTVRQELKARSYRALTPYALYVKETLPKLKRTYPHLPNSQLMKMCGEMWRSLPDADKEARRRAYQEQAAEFKAQQQQQQEQQH